MSYLNWNNSAYPYPANGTFSVDHWGYYNGLNNDNDKNKKFLDITNLDANLNEVSSTGYSYRNHNTEFAKCGVLNKITCPAGGYSTFDYEAHQYSKAIKRSSSNNFIPQLVSESGTCGGLRIQSIKNYPNYNATPVVKNYFYKDYSAGTSSSGILLNKPRYSIKYSANLSGTSVNDNNMTFRSSDLTEFNNIHIEYSNVFESLDDGSRIEYNFTNSSMPEYMDVVNYISTPEKTYHSGSYRTWTTSSPTDLMKFSNIVAPVVSKQFIRGRLLETEMFGSSDSQTPIYTETNEYDNNYTDSFTYLPHYFVRALGYMPVYTGKFNVSSTTQKQYRDNIEMAKTSSCTYNSHGQTSSVTTTDSKGITQTVEYKYITDTTTYPGGLRIIDVMARKNLINLPLEEKMYVVENSGAKTLIGGKQYIYCNPEAGKEAMIRLQETKFYDSETAEWITDSKYNAYDSYGNLLEKEDSNGIKTSYVWGYGGLYLVAKIDNCSLSTVKSISGLQNIQTAPLSGDMTGFETALRGKSGVEATTFYYKPLVGLAKIKSVSGKTVSYDYNRYGKLHRILNTAGELEVRYDYSPDNS